MNKNKLFNQFPLKYRLFVSLIIFSVLYGCASGKITKIATHEEVTFINKFAEQSTWLLGYFNVDRLKREPHSEWFIKEYNNYNPDTEAIGELLNILVDGIEIKVVLGTWCPDSRKHVPRFMRIIDLWEFPISEITFIGVDNAKTSPIGEYENLNIIRVPTFIFYKKNIEAGRIIENPATSLEHDIVNILN